MKILSGLAFIFVFCVQCTQKTINSHSVNVMETKSIGQFFDTEKNSLFDLVHSEKIVFAEDVKLFIIPLVSVKTENIRNASGEIVDNKAVGLDTTYMAFMIENNKKQGLCYKTFTSNKPEIFEIDTLLRDLGLNEDNLKAQNQEFGPASEIIKKGKIRIEKFLINKDTLLTAYEKHSQPDTLIRYFDASMRKIDFTFSRELDNKKNSKLVKTLIIYNPVPKGIASNNSEIPKRVMEVSMKTINVQNPQPYENLIAKFRLDAKKYKLN